MLRLMLRGKSPCAKETDTVTITERLRAQADSLRRKPTPLGDLIPLLQEAADAIEQASAAPAPALTDERAAFGQHFASMLDLTRFGDDYQSGGTSLAWYGWQARALLQAAPQPAVQPDTVARIRDIRDVQGEHGNWNLDPYMHGLYNGLEMALCIAEDRDPVFRGKPPEGWMGGRAATQAEPPAQTSGVAWPAPLSVERIAEIAAQHLHFPHDFGSQHFARAIEAAHGIGVASPARALLCEHECAEARLEGKPCGAGSCALLDVPPMSDGVPGTEGGQQA